MTNADVRAEAVLAPPNMPGSRNATKHAPLAQTVAQAHIGSVPPAHCHILPALAALEPMSNYSAKAILRTGVIEYSKAANARRQRLLQQGYSSRPSLNQQTRFEHVLFVSSAVLVQVAIERRIAIKVKLFSKHQIKYATGCHLDWFESGRATR